MQHMGKSMTIFTNVLLIFIATLSTSSFINAEIPFGYPLYKQCNSSWGQDVMVTTTICKVGCLMSSTSMALAGNSILIDGKIPANPGTVNTWLKDNNGYDSTNDFEEIERSDFLQKFSRNRGNSSTDNSTVVYQF